MLKQVLRALPLLLVLVPAVGSGTAPTGKEATTGVSGKPVTLVADGIDLPSALQSITHQSGIPVADRRVGADKRSITVAVKQATFWQALDYVARAVPCGISYYQPDGVIALVDGKPPKVAPSYSGIFRGIVKQIELTHNFEIDRRHCRLTLEFAWEPSFEPFYMEVKSYHGTFTAPGKPAPVPFAGQGKGPTPAHGRSAEEFVLQGAAPDRSATKLQDLKGELAVIGAAGMWTVRFPKLNGKNPQKETKGDVSATLQRFEVLDKGVWDAEIELRYPEGGPKFDTYQSWLVNNKVYLQNRKDKSVIFVPRTSDEEQRLRTDNRAVIVYHFAERKGSPRLVNPNDWDLVYRTPARLVQVTVPFTFREVPLP
jgi:hypothetical protein